MKYCIGFDALDPVEPDVDPVDGGADGADGGADPVDDDDDGGGGGGGADDPLDPLDEDVGRLIKLL